MKVSLLQTVLGITIVLSFVLIAGVIALTPVIGGYPPEPYMEHLKAFASLFSGVVGTVIGYFFGKRTSNSEA